MLSMTDVVDLALRNSPTTQESWATARAAAEAYGAARGALFPSLNGTVSATGTGSSGSGTLTSIDGTTIGTTTGIGDSTAGVARTSSPSTANRTLLSPSLTLSYTVFDLGGRAGTIEAAKQRAISADLAHNLNVQNVVLQVESSLFSYLATRALHDAQKVSVEEATADLAAAKERHRVGVASLSDELQAQTALSQAQLQLETLESQLQAARGTLAVSMGFQANLRYDIPNVTASDSVAQITASVDTLINRAIVTRPDIAGARADAAELAAEVRVARSAGYPALTLRSTATATNGLSGTTTNGRNYSLVLGLQIPIFNGFSTQYNVRAARDEYLAGLARVRTTTHQVSLEVFTSYFALQAAAQRVRTSTDLLASAQESANVALGRYRAGVGTIVDLLLARSALASARAESIQARWEWRTALVQLAHDMGTLDLAGRPNLPLGPDSTGIRR
jgi:outer membrane protein TolC